MKNASKSEGVKIMRPPMLMRIGVPGILLIFFYILSIQSQSRMGIPNHFTESFKLSIIPAISLILYNLWINRIKVELRDEEILYSGWFVKKSMLVSNINSVRIYFSGYSLVSCMFIQSSIVPDGVE
jgi:hypothetical protein